MSIVEIPEDWSDRRSWDDHYAELLSRPPYVLVHYMDLGTPTSGVNALLHFAEVIRSEGVQSIWIPGCGVSPLAHLLALLGFDVVATDVSPTAIGFQRSKPKLFERVASRHGLDGTSVPFVAEAHDFYDDFRNEEFDLIINVKAIQGFPIDGIRQIARVHARALRPGRYAFFDTMRVQGERRDNLEQALADAGFVVPHFTLNRWYRHALRETGIAHLLCGDAPMIPITDEYANQEAKHGAHLEQLMAIEAQYRSRLDEANRANASVVEPDAKMARINYAVG